MNAGNKYSPSFFLTYNYLIQFAKYRKLENNELGMMNDKLI
jgi:hypothetical protein